MVKPAQAGVYQYKKNLMRAEDALGFCGDEGRARLR